MYWALVHKGKQHLFNLEMRVLESVSFDQFRILKNAGSFKALKSQQIGELQNAKMRQLYIIGVQ